jgi:hypothetical protein
MKKIKKFLYKLLKIKTVTVRDEYYDYMTDSDDYDDPPTFIDVTYSERLGIILKKKLSKVQGYWGQESFLGDVQNFYKSCGINEWGGLEEYKKFSIYK